MDRLMPLGIYCESWDFLGNSGLEIQNGEENFLENPENPRKTQTNGTTSSNQKTSFSGIFHHFLGYSGDFSAKIFNFQQKLFWNLSTFSDFFWIFCHPENISGAIGGSG